MSLSPSLSNERRTELTLALRNKGNGWYVFYEWNVVLLAWNGCLYSQEQKEQGRCEKVFVRHTPDECLQAICDYKKVK